MQKCVWRAEWSLNARCRVSTVGAKRIPFVHGPIHHSCNLGVTGYVETSIDSSLREGYTIDSTCCQRHPSLHGVTHMVVYSVLCAWVI